MGSGAAVLSRSAGGIADVTPETFGEVNEVFMAPTVRLQTASVSAPANRGVLRVIFWWHCRAGSVVPALSAQAQSDPAIYLRSKRFIKSVGKFCLCPATR